MNKLLVIMFIVVCVSTAGAVPMMINYQGQVEVTGTPFDDTGYFKFAIVNSDGTTTYWSNDGTSAAGSEPVASVSIDVTSGLYHVILGATGGMDPLDGSVFANEMIYLRVWFDDGTTGVQLLSPDTRFTSVGFALKSAVADDADTVDGFQGADLEESAEIDADIAAHTGVADAHHAKTTSFADLTDEATDAQIPDDISINYAETAYYAESAYSAYYAANADNAYYAENAYYSYHAEIADNAVNSDTLDLIDSSQFLRSDQDDSMNGSLFIDGNVGIGTSDPVSLLDIEDEDTDTTGTTGVNMSIRNKNNINGAMCGIRFKNNENDGDIHYKAGIYYQRTGSWGRGDILFVNSNSNNSANATAEHTRMVIARDGNIGIGNKFPHGLVSIGKGTNMDQSQPAFSNATLTTDPQWQSFTAGDSGFLRVVQFLFNSVESATLSICEGEGPSGTLLYSASITKKPMSWIGHTLTSDVTLTAGEQYTIYFDDALAWAYTPSDNYPGGISSLGESSDFTFVTYMEGSGSAVIVTDSGRIGIGTDNPSHLLHISNTSGLSSEDVGIKIESGIDVDAVIEFSSQVGLFKWLCGVDGETKSFNIAGLSFDNPALTITKTGNVGIHDSTPETAFKVTGDAKIEGALYVTDVTSASYPHLTWDSSSGRIYVETSSRRFKENIQPLIDDFTLLLEAEPVVYTRPGDPDRWEIGYIAEEFQDKGLQNLLFFDDSGKPYSINYPKISLYLLEIVKMQSEQIQNQEDNIRTMSDRLDRLESIITEPQPDISL